MSPKLLKFGSLSIAFFLSVFAVNLWHTFNDNNAREKKYSATNKFSKVIYTCYLDSQINNSLEIVENSDLHGKFQSLSANYVDGDGERYLVNINGANLKWDYSGLRVTGKNQKIVVSPNFESVSQNQNWTIILKDQDVFLKTELKGCSVVSDE